MTNKIAIIGLGIMSRRIVENATAHPAFEISALFGCCVVGKALGFGAERRFDLPIESVTMKAQRRFVLLAGAQ